MLAGQLACDAPSAPAVCAPMRPDECPIRAGLGVIGGPWKPLILSCLLDGGKRFGELRDVIPDAPEKVLSQQLRELERDGLVARQEHYEGEDALPKAEYSLTPHGQTLRPVMSELRKWGGKHRARGKVGRG